MLTLSNLKVHLDNRLILDDISFTIPLGKITGIIGVSGSGKTTLLHTLSGLIPPSEGDLTPVIAPKDVALVMQEHGLFPWKTVMQNIKLARVNQQQDRPYLNQIIEDLNLKGLESRYPHQLSGGQSQRVSIARALYKSPKLILMDEPTASLDEINQLRLQQLLKRLQEQYHLTIVYVTHHLQEALNLSDHIVVLKDGSVAHWFKEEDVKSIDHQVLYNAMLADLSLEMEELE